MYTNYIFTFHGPNKPINPLVRSNKWVTLSFYIPCPTFLLFWNYLFCFDFRLFSSVVSLSDFPFHRATLTSLPTASSSILICSEMKLVSVYVFLLSLSKYSSPKWPLLHCLLIYKSSECWYSQTFFWVW